MLKLVSQYDESSRCRNYRTTAILKVRLPENLIEKKASGTLTVQLTSSFKYMNRFKQNINILFKRQTQKSQVLCI